MREDYKNVGPNNKNSRRPYYNKRNRNKYSRVENDILPNCINKTASQSLSDKRLKKPHEI